MTKLMMVISIALLAGCASVESTVPQAPEPGGSIASTSAVQLASGPEVAANLERRYRDTRDNCGSASMPAFLCSGLLMRGGVPSNTFDVWNPSPISVANGGVSFTYLRSDYKVKMLAYTYDAGFIFYPILGKPEGKEKIEILCFFPVDGSSNARPDGGCGAHKNYPEISKSCELQNPVIDTAAKWVAKYRADQAAGRNKNQALCSFNVRDSANNVAAGRFLEGMRAGRAISPDAFNTTNDTKLKTWAQNIPGRLPIEAFFYTKPSGLAGAQFFQRRFREATGLTVPIIYIPLPQTLEQSATFTYRAADQTM